MCVRTGYRHGQFCWVDLLAADAQAMQSFYESLFGWDGVWQDTKGGPPYLMFQKSGKSVAGLGQMSDEMQENGSPNLWNTYVNVDDVEATAARAAELGGSVVMPTMKVVDAGWMAAIQDPTGGTLMLWQKENHFGAERINEPGSFCWNELATRDVTRASEFFAPLFGWEYAPNPHSPAEYQMIKSHGEDIGGIMGMDENWPADTPPHWMVYFAVDEIAAACSQLTELGGRVCIPPFSIPIGKIAIVGDPQGGTFSFFEHAAVPETDA